MSRGVLGLGTLAALGGCSYITAPLIPDTKIEPAAQKRALESARYQSVNAALAKIDAKTVTAWVNRWTAPNGVALITPPAQVNIDAEAIAHRHPAWKLADSLESGAISPSSPQIARVLAVSSPSFSPVQALGATVVTRTLPAKIVGENFDASAARQRQDASLDRFFTSTEARDTLRIHDEAFLSRRALEDAIAAAQSKAVSELDLSLVSPEVALELTNLRLQLLRALSRTPEQRAATREEIQAIEDRYAKLWREQTDLQNAKLREAAVEMPLRQRREGVDRIARESASSLKQEADERHSVSIDARSRLESDFAKDSAKLRLALPPARSVGRLAQNPHRSDSQFFETTVLGGASSAPQANEALTESQTFDPKVTARLRTKARTEARQWATLVAAQLGSRWNNKPGNPDRTAAALAILFPSAS